MRSKIYKDKERNKSMKKSVLITGIIIVLLLILLGAYLVIKSKEKIALSPPTFPIPQNCSNESIISVWNSIFVESSSGISILTNTTQQNVCNSYLAYKISGDNLYTLAGISLDNFLLMNITMINAMQGNFSQEFLSNFSNLIYNQNLSQSNLNYIYLISQGNVKPRNITFNNADSEFKSIFKINTTAWQINTTGNLILYYFNSSFNENNHTIIFDAGIVSANYSLIGYSFNKIVLNIPQNCISNWTAVNSTCITNETIVTRYADTNLCNLPEIQNITGECDYNNNGIIGNFSSFTSDTNLNVYINSAPANISETFNTTRTIEFREGNISRVRFDYNFSVPLNMKRIRVKRQPPGDSLGYLIVNNINVAKTFWVDKINETSRKVCVKNEHVNNISELSDNCNRTNEYVVECPGSNSSFSCNIIEGRFYVSGLTSSAVKEVILPREIVCQPSWNCTDWSRCISGTRTRSCVDTKNCNSTLNIPVLSEACISCIPDWNCTAWQPEKCPKTKNQTRTCADKNSCGIVTSKNEAQTCEYKSNFMWLIISLLVFGILGIMAVIIVYILNKEKPKPFSQVISPPNQPAGGYGV